MADREKVIRRLAEVSEYTRAKADIAGVGKGKEVFDSWYRAVEDAITLLREQEPVVATWYQVDGIFGLEVGYKCGVCNAEIAPEMMYCPRCGRRIRWDATD